MDVSDYLHANKQHWDERTDHNAAHWDVVGFARDPLRLTKVVEADRAYLGDVRGMSLLHLQCHFGMDTLSWAKLGARVTGVDFSPRAVAVATQLAQEMGADARFVEADLYDAPHKLNETFDVVYTGVGALSWLPDVAGWARVVAALLKPGGAFYIREAHPVLWSLEDERDDDLLVIDTPYFETPDPKEWDDDQVWDDNRPVLPHMTQYNWAHGIGEIVTALINAGLTIDFLHEHRRLAWHALPFMEQDEAGWWKLPSSENRLPLMYSLGAHRTA